MVRLPYGGNEETLSKGGGVPHRGTESRMTAGLSLETELRVLSGRSPTETERMTRDSGKSREREAVRGQLLEPLKHSHVYCAQSKKRSETGASRNAGA